MKKSLRILFLGILLFASPLVSNYIPFSPLPTVSAMTNSQDPNGFGDVHWDETISDIQSSHKTTFLGRNDDAAHYSVLIPDAKGSLNFEGPVTIRAIFIDNKLFGIEILFSGDQFETRLAGMTKMLGTPVKRRGYYIWGGPLSLIILLPYKEDELIILAKNQQGVQGIAI
jgi:hypothetical protein